MLRNMNFSEEVRSTIFSCHMRHIAALGDATGLAGDAAAAAAAEAPVTAADSAAQDMEVDAALPAPHDSAAPSGTSDAADAAEANASTATVGVSADAAETADASTATAGNTANASAGGGDGDSDKAGENASAEGAAGAGSAADSAPASAAPRGLSLLQRRTYRELPPHMLREWCQEQFDWWVPPAAPAPIAAARLSAIPLQFDHCGRVQRAGGDAGAAPIPGTLRVAGAVFAAF